jgi:hypothetical protein
MTTQPTGGSAVQPRAQTLRFQKIANWIMRGLLRVPLVNRAVGRWLVTVYIVGRKSGLRYAVPVAYTRRGDTLLIGTPFAWRRNLRSGEPVDIRLKGRRRRADLRLFTDEPSVVEHYAVMARSNHTFASFNKIGFDAAGNPDPTDLHLGWASGARAILLTPR